MPVAPYPRGKARCVTDTGTSPNIGDQNWPMRSVVRPFVRSTNAKRARSCGCSSPNGGVPLNAPKKSASSVAFGAQLPSTGPELKSSRMRVFRMSPSKKLRSVPGCTWAAHSAFCPCPKPPVNNPRSLNRSEEHTSELQSQSNLVCSLLLEKKNTKKQQNFYNKKKTKTTHKKI